MNVLKSDFYDTGTILDGRFVLANNDTTVFEKRWNFHHVIQRCEGLWKSCLNYDIKGARLFWLEPGMNASFDSVLSVFYKCNTRVLTI